MPERPALQQRILAWLIPARYLTTLAVAVAALALPSPAAAWDPFLVENPEVEDGNERMAADDATTALSYYDEAAGQLPTEPGVHLDRGLALLESGELDQAIEAFERASQPPASAEIRADAYYDTGIAQYRLADAAATEENHEEAQRQFREAADAFRQSLRMRPGNDDAGWNLELALRRIQEQEEQQQQEEEQQNQDDQEGDDQEGDDQEGDDQEQEGDDQEGDDQEQEGDDQEGDDQSQEGDDQEGDDQEGDDQEGDNEEEDGQGPGDQPRDPAESQEEPGGTQEGSLPPEHRRVLDALQDSEENLERYRARNRAARENRRVEQDW